MFEVFLSSLFSHAFFSLYVGLQIPNCLGGESTGSTKDNPFTLPDAYMASQQKNVCLKC